MLPQGRDLLKWDAKQAHAAKPEGERTQNRTPSERQRGQGNGSPKLPDGRPPVAVGAHKHESDNDGGSKGEKNGRNK